MKSVDPSDSSCVAMPVGSGVDVGVRVGVDVAVGLGVNVGVGVKVRVGVGVSVANKLTTPGTPQDKLATAKTDAKTNKNNNPLFLLIVDSSFLAAFLTNKSKINFRFAFAC